MPDSTKLVSAHNLFGYLLLILDVRIYLPRSSMDSRGLSARVSGKALKCWEIGCI